jgi:hypothetical protein
MVSELAPLSALTLSAADRSRYTENVFERELSALSVGIFTVGRCN